MRELILTLIFILLPFILVILLRTNAAILFFVITGASTLQTYLDKDVTSFASSFLPGKNVQTISMVLFIVPFFVAAIAFRRTVSKNMLILHLLLALTVGISLVFISPQFLPAAVVTTIRASKLFTLFEPYTSIVIAASFLASVVVLWFSHPKHESAKKRGH